MRLEVVSGKIPEQALSVFSELLVKFTEPQASRMARAIADFEINPIETAVGFQKYGIRSEADRVEVAKVMASKNGLALSAFIRRFNIKNRNTLFDIAKIACYSKTGIHYYVDQYRIKNKAQLLELAKIEAKFHGSPVLQHIHGYKVTDAETIHELTLTASKIDPIGVSLYLMKNPQNDQKKLVEIVKLIASHSSWTVCDKIKSFGITDEEHRIQIAKIIAAQDGRNISDKIKEFQISDQKALVEIAKIAIRQNVWGTSKLFKNYGIFDERDRTQVAMVGAYYDVSALRQWFRAFEIKSKRALFEVGAGALAGGANDHDLSKLGIRKYSRKRLSEKAIDYLFQIESPSNNRLKWFTNNLFSETDEANLPLVEKLTRLCDIRCKNSALMSRIKDAFSSEVKTEDEVLSIFTWLIGHSDQWRAHDSNGIALSRFALEKASGLDPFEGLKPLSPNSARNLYSIILDLIESFNGPIPIEIEPECWRKDVREQTLEILELLRGVSLLGGEVNKVHITRDNLLEARNNLATDIANLFEQKLDLSNASVDSVLELQKVWGDLTAIFILYGRLQGYRSEGALKALKEITLACINGNFNEFKYSDRNQLPFSEDLIGAWTKNPYSMACVEASENGASTNEARFENAVNVLKTNFFPHVKEFLQKEEYLFKNQLRERMKRINQAVQTDDSEELKSTVRELMGLSEKYLLTQEIRKDLKSVKDLLEPPRKREGKGYVIFSTITDDPKLLLTIGDLVDTSSCQNYRTGSIVRTLPAYVMDANIKALLSFVIPSSKLSNQPVILDTILKDPKLVRVVFNAPRLTLTLSIESGEETEIKLGQAVRRHILRLGSDQDGSPCLLTERGYIQNHVVEPAIEENAKNLISLFQSSLPAKNAEPGTRFPSSRNDCGIYSDACGGIKRGKYVLEPPRVS